MKSYKYSKMNLSVFCVQFVEEDCVLGTRREHAKYSDLISRPDASVSERKHYSKVYGINRVSVVTQLQYFDVTSQLPQDLMHVLLEGVFPLHMEQFLKYIVEDMGVLTLDQINFRIAAYPYAYFDEKPSQLYGYDLKGNQTGWFGALVNVQ